MAKRGRKKKNIEESVIVQDVNEPNDENIHSADNDDIIDTHPTETNENNIILVENTESTTNDTSTINEIIVVGNNENISNKEEQTPTIGETSENTESVAKDDSTANELIVVKDSENTLTEVEQTLDIAPEKTKTSIFFKFKEKWNHTFDWLHQHKLIYRILQITLCLVLFIGANIAVICSTYFGYIQSKYYRIEDGEEQKVERNRTWYLATNNTYSAITMDIGYGIHIPQYSNINEEGMMKNGQKTKGEYNFGIDETSVIENVTKLKDYIRHLDADFYAFQDVDVVSDRSYKVNQYEELNEALARYSRVAARYHHTQYLAYPLSNPIGLINSDLVTYSRYKTTYGSRHQLPIETTFTSRLSAADTCFSLTLMPVNGSGGKHLLILNVKLDKNENVRKQQMDVLNAFMLEEYEYGNYVIVAGNFNSDTATVDGNFANEQQAPKWLNNFDESQIVDGYAFIHPTNETELANYRTTDIPYEESVNYQAHTSGFIVSNNITAESIVLDSKYEFSNHNPVKLTFKLLKP